MEYIFISFYTIVTVLLMGTAFFIGLKLGTLIRQENQSKIDNIIPKIPNPIKKIKEIKNEKESQEKLNELSQIIENLNAYDGTSNSQKSIVKGGKHR